MAVSKFPCPLTFSRTVFFMFLNLGIFVRLFLDIVMSNDFDVSRIFFIPYGIYNSSVSDPRFQWGSRIRMGIQDPDPDPAFYLYVDPDPDPGSQTNADPYPGQWSDVAVTKSLIFASLKGWKS
jgi:hypothetical protein